MPYLTPVAASAGGGAERRSRRRASTPATASSARRGRYPIGTDWTRRVRSANLCLRSISHIRDRSGFPRVAPAPLRSFHDEDSDTLGAGDARRAAGRAAAGRREALLVGRRAARGRARRALDPVRVRDGRRRAPRPGDAARARRRAPARGARQDAGARSRRSAWEARPRRMRRPTSEPHRRASRGSAPPSVEPSSGSTACSGCGISPNTLPSLVRSRRRRRLPRRSGSRPPRSGAAI